MGGDVVAHRSPMSESVYTENFAKSEQCFVSCVKKRKKSVR
jgi:hypothetical protein